MPLGPAWGILVLLTVGSLMVVESGLVGVVSSAVVIGVAAVKARLIMRHFMELESLPRTWQLSYTMWIVAASAVILIGNYIGVLFT